MEVLETIHTLENHVRANSDAIRSIQTRLDTTTTTPPPQQPHQHRAPHQQSHQVPHQRHQQHQQKAAPGATLSNRMEGVELGDTSLSGSRYAHLPPTQIGRRARSQPPPAREMEIDNRGEGIPDSFLPLNKEEDTEFRKGNTWQPIERLLHHQDKDNFNGVLIKREKKENKGKQPTQLNLKHPQKAPTPRPAPAPTRTNNNEKGKSQVVTPAAPPTARPTTQKKVSTVVLTVPVVLAPVHP